MKKTLQSKMLKMYEGLNSARISYDGKVGDLEQLIVEYVDFEFSIVYHPSDGFCILDVERVQLSPLNQCLAYINKNGLLSREAFNKFCI